MILNKSVMIWTTFLTKIYTKSTCTSAKHSEYSCMIKWSVTSKFDSTKWCAACKERYDKN